MTKPHASGTLAPGRSRDEDGVGGLASLLASSLSAFASSTPRPVRRCALAICPQGHLTPLTPQFPPNRLGPDGDGPKVGCATCHKGTFKPLHGVSPLTDYLALSGVGKVPPGVPSEPAEPDAGASAVKTSQATTR